MDKELFWRLVGVFVLSVVIETPFLLLISREFSTVSIWHWFIFPGLVLGILFLSLCFKYKKLYYDSNTDINNRITAFFTHIFVPVCKHIHTLEHKFVTGVYHGEFGEIISAEWENTLRQFYSIVIQHNVANKNLIQDYYIVPWSQRLEDAFTEQYPDWEKRIFYWKDIPNIETLVTESDFDKQHELFSQKMLYIGSKYIFNCSQLSDAILGKTYIFCWNLFIDKQQTEIKNPKDFETKVANDLKQLGFSTHMTKATGDQGVDVLATKNDIKFAIQCKLYSHPVGNKAVQEVCAGRDFYRCDYAVVVTNASFTKAARQCAKATDVILLNDNQLDELLKYV